MLGTRSSYVAYGDRSPSQKRPEPKAVARVAFLFPPDFFHPLLAFLQRHL
jgi:hypothetical protein